MLSPIASRNQARGPKAKHVVKFDSAAAATSQGPRTLIGRLIGRQKIYRFENPTLPLFFYNLSLSSESLIKTSCEKYYQSLLWHYETLSKIWH